MGLGAPKNRNKLSHDPNNTAWSKSTENFGHRILSSQGWKPGEYLGASNAAHADHYTAANASHVRVFLREDNLGIGAKVGGKGNAETFGLSTLSSIFGRLNGKSDVEVQTQQSNLRNAELRTYQAQKYGFMNFVSGGLLIGDKIEDIVKDVPQVKPPVAAADDIVPRTKSSKKRKAEAAAHDTTQGEQFKKKKRSSVVRAELGALPAQEVEEKATPMVNPSRKGEKAVESEQPEIESEDFEDAESKIARLARKAARKAERASRRTEKGGSSDEKARTKEEKRARKEERRKRKEEKRGIKAKEPDLLVAAAAIPTPPSGVSTPLSAGLAFGGGRHAVRQRYIQQKRMASLDPQALKEILMIKAQA